MGCSPWGHKDLDMTEPLTHSLFHVTIYMFNMFRIRGKEGKFQHRHNFIKRNQTNSTTEKTVFEIKFSLLPPERMVKIVTDHNSLELGKNIIYITKTKVLKISETCGCKEELMN